MAELYSGADIKWLIYIVFITSATSGMGDTNINIGIYKTFWIFIKLASINNQPLENTLESSRLSRSFKNIWKVSRKHWTVPEGSGRSATLS